MPYTDHTTTTIPILLGPALDTYAKLTGLTNPFVARLQACDTPDSVHAWLQEQVKVFNERRDQPRLTKWFTPMLNVLYALSTIPGLGGVSMVYSGVEVLLAATAKGVPARQRALVDIFERVGNFFQRLEFYIETPLSSQMMDTITRTMVEVLCILEIVMKDIKKGRMKKRLEKLVKGSEIKDALKRLDKLMQEEALMATSQAMRVSSRMQNEARKSTEQVLMESSQRQAETLMAAMQEMMESSRMREDGGNARPDEQGREDPSAAPHRPPTPPEHTPATTEPSQQERNPSSVPRNPPVPSEHTHAMTDSELPSRQDRMDSSAAQRGPPAPPEHTPAMTDALREGHRDTPAMPHSPLAPTEHAPTTAEPPSRQEHNPSSIPHEPPVPPDLTQAITELPSLQDRKDPSSTQHGPPAPSEHTPATTDPPTLPQPVSGPRRLDRSNSHTQENEAVGHRAERVAEGLPSERKEGERVLVLEERENCLKDSANAELNATTSSVPDVIKSPPESSVQREYSSRNRKYDFSALRPSNTSDSRGQVGQSSNSAPPLDREEAPITLATSFTRPAPAIVNPPLGLERGRESQAQAGPLPPESQHSLEHPSDTETSFSQCHPQSFTASRNSSPKGDMKQRVGRRLNRGSSSRPSLHPGVLDSQERSMSSTKPSIEVRDGPVTPQPDRPVPPEPCHPLESERPRVQLASLDDRHTSDGQPPPGLRRVGPRKSASFWRWRLFRLKSPQSAEKSTSRFPDDQALL